MKDINEQSFLRILAKYNAGTASQDEVAFLEAYYNLFESNDAYLNNEYEGRIKEMVKLKIDRQLNRKSESIKAPFLRYAAAAVVLLSIAAGVYYNFYTDSSAKTELVSAKDRAPGRTKATLTLANGKVIELDEGGAGKIAEDGGMSILNTPEGKIIYVGMDSDSKVKAESQVLNTVATPKGGQYQLVLADGTRVWLNSASSITYSTSFGQQERTVVLQGEAYFEVAKVKSSIFKVKTANQLIEVLGTHFNVNAYQDESSTVTTLMEGAVKLSAGASSKVLQPGQQAKVEVDSKGITLVSAANVDKAIAWKNGLFSFENEDLKTIMRQISRWYDVDVIYSGPMPQEKFFGEISRNTKLSEVCKILELNNLNFAIEARSIKVSARP